jgi:hypothetical protein
MAETEYRRMLARTPPGWTVKLYSWTVIPLAVIGVPVLFGLTQPSVGWGPRHWVVLAGLAPFLVTLVPALILWARSESFLYLKAIGGKLRPGPKNAWGGSTCGLCGAPLTIEPEALGATCSYCHADSWLSGSAAIEAEKADEQRHDRNLADLVRAGAFQSFDIRLLLIVYPAISIPVMLLMYFLLPAGWE